MFGASKSGGAAIVISPTPWPINKIISIDVDGLEIGIYNFTL